ncbi:MAG: cobalamin-dependent protein [Acidimicrobiales bacterium]
MSSVSAELLEMAASGRPRPAIDYALGQISDGLPADILILQVLADVQREVGRLWQSNQWSVAQEHAATAVIDGVLGAIGLEQRTSPAPQRGNVLVACVEEEYHSLPARMGAERLRYDGWNVTFLGASVPAHDLQQFVVDADPDVTVLSCTLSLHLPGAARSISALADVGAVVVVAGAGFGDTSDRATRLGASGWIGPSVNATSVLERPLPPARSATFENTESAQLQLQDHELVEACMTEMFKAIPRMTSFSAQQLNSSRRDLAYILRYLTIAIDLDEPHLFDEFITWLQRVLIAREVPPAVLLASLQMVGDVVHRAGLEQSAALCQAAQRPLVDTHQVHDQRPLVTSVRPPTSAELAQLVCTPQPKTFSSLVGDGQVPPGVGQ